MRPPTPGVVEPRRPRPVRSQRPVVALRAVLFSALALLVACASLVLAPAHLMARAEAAVTSTVTPAANPTLPAQCQLNVALSIDLSTSITDAQATAIRAQLVSLADSLSGYPVKLAFNTFGTSAPAGKNTVLPLTSVATAAGVTAVKNWVQAMHKPSDTQYTNWDAAFTAVNSSYNSADPYHLMVFVTDGNPNRALSSSGQVTGTGVNPTVEVMTEAVRAANLVKAKGIRVVPVGVQDNVEGTALTDLQAHLKQVSGPTENTDYFISQLGQLKDPILANVNSNCTRISVDKTGVVQPNGSIAYTFTVTNGGELPLNTVTLSDPKIPAASITWGAWPGGTAGTLPKGGSVTATASYTPTAAELDAGRVTNTVTVSGKSPTGYVNTATDSDTRVLSRGITLSKTGVLADGARGRVGDRVTYTFVVRNTGTLTMTGVGVSDPLEGLSAITWGPWPGASPGVLGQGQSVTGTAVYQLTAADVAARSVHNQATASGTPSVGGTITASATHDLTLPANASVSLSKCGALGSGATGRAGDPLGWTLRVTNDGNVPLTDLAVSDPGVVLTWPSSSRTLAPGASLTVTGSSALTQAQVDASEAVNTASVSAASSAGPVSDTARATVSVPGAPALTLVKTGTRGSGRAITWGFTVRNTGNVTLRDLVLNDTLAGLSTPVWGTWPGGVAGTLAPGAAVTATATSTATQAQVDAGSVTNDATVTGLPPSGTTRVTASDSATVTFAAQPAIGLRKTGALAGGTSAGDLVNWTFVLTNGGNVTLDVALSDTLAGLSGFTWPSSSRSMPPGAEWTVTAASRLTQAQVDAGQVRNAATLTGTPPRGDAVTDTSTAIVPVLPAPAIEIEKTGTLGADGLVTWGFTLTNSGNVTLRQVQVSDELAGLSDLAWGTWPHATVGLLAPGAQVTATATSSPTSAQWDAGVIANTATATGVPPAGGSPVTDADTARVTLPGDPAITADKSGTLAEGASGRVGDVVEWTVTVRNAGNVTLHDVSLADDLPGLYDLTWPSASRVMPAGATWTLTAKSRLTAAQVDAGLVTNTATVRGLSPTDRVVTDPGSATVTLAAGPAVEIIKTGVLRGTEVLWSFTLTNTGNVTLREVTLTDTLPGLSAITWSAWPDEESPGVLPAGDSVRATATSVPGARDWDTGLVSNTAAVSALPPVGTTRVVDEDTASVRLPAWPEIGLDKSGRLSEGATGTVGDEVEWTFVLSNTGNVTLDVALTDELAGLQNVSWPSASRSLPAGDSWTVTATSVLSAAQVDSGQVVNRATVSGRSPSGSRVTSTDSARVRLPAAPAIEVVKTGVASSTSVAWTFVVTNGGNVTLDGVRLVDSLSGLSPIEFPEGFTGVLAAGASVTATASSPITQRLRDAGTVRNEVTVFGTPPGAAEEVTDGDETLVTLPQTPGLSFAKSGALAEEATGAIGDLVEWTFTVRNTGNVTLSQVAVSDELAGLSAITWPSASRTLAPGQEWILTATSPVTRELSAAGAVRNTATATANPPRGAVLEVPAAATVPLPSLPSITLSKTGSLGVDGVVTWQFAVRNSGNVPLHGVRVNDHLAGVSDIVWGQWPSAEPGLLAAGDTVLGTATSTPTLAQWNDGVVRNTATASGLPPAELARVSADGEADVVLPAAPGIDLTKTGSLQDDGSVEYEFTLTNTGNVTLTGVALEDPLEGLGTVEFGEWPGPATALDPGQSVVATARYAPDQHDRDAGQVINEARAVGYPPGEDDDPAHDTDVVTTLLPQVPALDLAKTGALAQGATGRAGDQVHWDFTVTNTGTVTLTGVEVSDDLVGIGPLTFGTWPGATGVLAPGDQVQASASSVLSIEDVDHGSVTNTATVTAQPPGASDPVQDQDTAVVSVEPGPAINLVKTGRLEGGVIHYGFTLANTGNVTLRDVTLVDELKGLSEIVFAEWPGRTGVLRSGEQVQATATYRVKAADVEHGAVDNHAEATGAAGSAVSGPTVRRAVVVVRDDDATRTPIPAAPALGLVKSAQRVGDLVTYTFTVTNTGNVTLRKVALEDELPGLGQVVFGTWPGVTGTLTPGQSVAARAVYRLTDADREAGRVDNVATASGVMSRREGDSSQEEAQVRDEDDVTVPVPEVAGFEEENPQAPSAGPGQDLPDTGSASALLPMVATGMGLVLAGVALVARRRRIG